MGLRKFFLSFLAPGDPGIVQTAYKIRSVVRWAVRRPEIRYAAEEAIAACPERDEDCEVRSIFEYVSERFRFVKDIRGVELVKSPEVAQAEIKKNGAFLGDCDDATAYAAALLTAVGYIVRLVIIAPPGGKKFKHIYLEARTRRGWLPFELTARQHDLGWSAPSGKKQFFYI